MGIISTLLYVFAAICLVLGFVSLLGWETFDISTVMLFVLAAVFAIVGWALAGGFHRRVP